MGEYYSWVNLDRREFIQCGDFDDCLCKLYQTVWYDCLGVKAFYTLLSAEWKEQRVLFLGDETDANGDHNNPIVAKLIEEHRSWGQPRYLFDYVYENYRDITPWFKAAEESLRSEIERIHDASAHEFDPYHIDRDAPFRGMFERPLSDYRFVVNETKHEFLDRQKAQKSSKGNPVNPLPLLMAYITFDAEPFIGSWIGDRLRTANQLPQNHYKEMSNAYRIRGI